MQLDFSQFHPLDHWPGSAYCRSLPGGTRNHLKMTWSYRRRPMLASWTLCRIGRHRIITARRRDSVADEWVSFQTCNNCCYTP